MVKIMEDFCLAATVGDPSSIGPEVAIQALQKFFSTKRSCSIRLFLPEQTALKYRSALRTLKSKKRVEIVEVLGPHFNLPGKHSARLGLEALKLATDLCIEQEAAALVTGPLDKNLCAQVNKNFRGHTEYLQERCKVPKTTMLLSGGQLQVALVTTHIPLSQVPKAITSQKIIETALQVYQHLKSFFPKPRIAVAALNPHASDGGLFGNEEKTIIEPAIKKLKKKIPYIAGPFPADSLFAKSFHYDAVICQYHDQGLIPLKMLHFYDAVNVTLGLPFLRTSVDHGTAFDIVGKGLASSQSYFNSLEYAYEWVRAKHSNPRRKRT
jgi:4-hydroxythreonine-4-phosphate dehydrogenase